MKSRMKKAAWKAEWKRQHGKPDGKGSWKILKPVLILLDICILLFV